jgi:hypothetical protein
MSLTPMMLFEALSLKPNEPRRGEEREGVEGGDNPTGTTNATFTPDCGRWRNATSGRP